MPHEGGTCSRTTPEAAAWISAEARETWTGFETGDRQGPFTDGMRSGQKMDGQVEAGSEAAGSRE